MPRPHCLLSIDQRNAALAARAAAGAKLLEWLAYAAAIGAGLGLSAIWPMGCAAP